MKTIAVTSALFISLAAVVLLLRRVRPQSLLESPYSVLTQALAGVAVGATLAVAQLLLVRVWGRWREYTRDAVRSLRLTTAQIVSIAFMVAVAEELFFRAAVQPLLGIWLASAFFALVHMRPDRKAWAGERLVFALVALLLLLCVSTSLGFVYARVGLVAAMASHFVYDVIVLQGYQRLHEPRAPADKP
ncbi:MAG TPA: CPBP family intramembrane glutamic endopeptidase [Pyrinomonadaceae bacterium]